MQFTREINRLLGAVLILFGVVAAAALYWQIVGPDSLLLREDNPRLVLAEAAIVRGDIVDRDGEVLAASVTDASGVVTRQYLHPETSGALGYFSLRYGVGGAEAAYNATLRGDDLPRDLTTVLTTNLLHRAQQGSDVRLTIDLDIQREVARAMDGRTGAAVVLAVPSGEVLAMVSVPGFDPNTLDANWDALRDDPGKPFFNRVVQGNYQPGSTLQTSLMAAALLYDVSLDEPIEGATQPVMVDDVRLGCAVRLPDVPLTLREAYAFSCPYPFARLAEQLGGSAVEAALETFVLNGEVTLDGFGTPPDVLVTPVPTMLSLEESTLAETAVGQGNLTVTPLGMASLAAAIVNDGNAPPPYTLLDTRAPGADAWQPVEVIRPTTPVATVNTARQLQDLMRDAVANGAAQNAGRPNIDIGGHAALAYSGDDSQAWFVGFATLGGRRGVSVAVVLENSSDPGLAADIGGGILAAAQEASASMSP